jgi:hypothetical protein
VLSRIVGPVATDSRLHPDLEYVRLKGQHQGAAQRNRAFTTGVASTATLTAPSAAIYLCAVLQSVASGFFQVTASGTGVAGAVESAGATVSLITNTPAVAGAGITVSGGQTSGVGVSVSSESTAITLAATSGSLVGASTKSSQQNLNGLTSSATSFGWSLSGIVGVDNTPDPLANGSYMAIAIVGTIATTSLELTSIMFSAWELY